jgi:hypothetical protein
LDVSPYNPKQSLELEMVPGIYYTAIIVPSQDPQTPNGSTLKLFSWQGSTKSWKEVYSEALSYMSSPEMKKNRIIPDRDSLVLYTIQGSGSFVSLRVLAYWDNNYKVIVSPSEPHGHSRVLVEADRVIIESFSGYQTIYSWDGTKVVISNAQKSAPVATTSDVFFRYNTLDDGKIELPSETISLKVGDVVHIVQGQSLAKYSGVRLLSSSDEMQKILEYQQGSKSDHQVYKAIGTGTAVVKIIGNGGYDWKHARKVTIEVAQP